MAYHDVTGVLLVGGASRRFGSPKATVLFHGEMLAERAYRVLGESFPNVIAVGKAQEPLPLPFPILDDGSVERAAIVGVAAALRLAESDLCVILPTDMPLVTPTLLRLLADGARGVDVAVPQTGPLPGAYRRSALPTLERRIEQGDLALRRSLAELETRKVACDPALLRNVNTTGELDELSRPAGATSVPPSDGAVH